MIIPSHAIKQRTSISARYGSKKNLEAASLESVEVQLAGVILEPGVDDGVGDLGGVAELRRQATNLVADAQNLLREQPGMNRLFCYFPNSALLNLLLQMTLLGFFLTPMPWRNKRKDGPSRDSNPRQSVELHQTGTFRTLYQLSYSAAAGMKRLESSDQ